MPAIPIPMYESRVPVPHGGGPPLQRGVGIANPLEGLGELSQGLQGVARAVKQAQDEKAIAWSGEQMSATRSNLTKSFYDLQTSTTPEAFAKEVDRAIDAEQSRVFKLAPSRAARDFAESHLTQIRSEFGVRAQEWTASETRRQAGASLERGLDAASSVVAADPAQFDQVMREQRKALEVQAPHMLPEQRDRAQERLDAIAVAAAQGDIARDPRAARDALGQRLGIAPGAPLSDGVTAPSVSVGDPSMLSAIAKAESNDRGFDDKGRVIRGPKTASGEHALGRFQLMPGTAKQAAKLAGVEWDAKRYESGDEAYHRQLATAYLDEISHTFRGNVPATAAAWNMGPEAAAAWASGKPYQTASGKTWTPSRPMDPNALPTETRNYVAKVTASLGLPVATTAAPADAPRVRPAQLPDSSAYAHLPVSAVVQLYSAADADVRRLDNEAEQQARVGQETFRLVAEDRRTALKAGEWQPIPAEADYVAAYGAERGPRVREQDRTLQTMSGDLAALQTATPEQAAAILERNRPTGSENRETRQYAFEQLQQAAVRTAQARFVDPMGDAMSRKVGGVAPINLQDPAKFQAELSRRLPVAMTMAKDYGTPFSLLTKGEAEQLRGWVGNMTAPEQAETFRRVRAAVPDARAYQSVMQQLRPDSPVTALAGSILGVPGYVTPTEDGHGIYSTEPLVAVDEKGARLPASLVAQRILEGEKLLNPTTDDKKQDGRNSFPMPDDDKLREQWANYTRTAYASSPDAEATAYRAYLAFYAAEAAHAGHYDKQLQTSIARRAVRAVTGGVVSVNGSNIVLPWGTDETTARRQLDGNWRELRKQPEFASIPFNAVQLSTIGNGKYSVWAGTGPLRDKRGQPIVLTVDRYATPLPGGAP